MATRPNAKGGASALPQQPGLRSFIVYDCLPPGCIAFPVTDNDAAPLLRVGDIAVLDPVEPEPIEHELFVIEWGRSSGNPRRCLVELWQRELENAEGKFFGWFAGAYNRPRTQQEAFRRARAEGVLRCFIDGPYPARGSKNGDYLPSLLIGRVVGILEPRFEEPKRLGSAVQS